MIWHYIPKLYWHWELMIWHYIPQTLLAVKINDMTLYSRLHRQWELMMWPYILQVLLAVWLPVFLDVWNVWHFIPQTSLTVWNVWHLCVTFYSSYFNGSVTLFPSHFTGNVKCVTLLAVSIYDILFSHIWLAVRNMWHYIPHILLAVCVCVKCVAFYPTDDIKCA